MSFKADSTTTTAFYVAVKHWAGAAVGGTVVFMLYQVIGASDPWQHLGSVAAVCIQLSFYVLFLTFPVVLPYAFVVRFVLARTGEQEPEQRQKNLAVTALLTAGGIAFLLGCVVSQTSEPWLVVGFLLPWIATAGLLGWRVRP